MRSRGITGRDKSRTPAAPGLQHRRRQPHNKNVGTVERWGSAIGGAALAVYGLKRRSLGGAALTLLGGD